MSEWISVEDRLPEPMRPVLVYCANGDWYGVYWIEERRPDQDPGQFIERWWNNKNLDIWPADGVAINEWSYFDPAEGSFFPPLPEPPK